MTPEQITARCEQFIREECYWRFPATSVIESLYREAMSNGVKQAYDILCNCDGDLDFAKFKIRNVLMGIDVQAAKLKEPPCDTSSS